nr:hypothetical protein GCM10020092_052360 [Actinoplanes digitatis]
MRTRSDKDSTTAAAFDLARGCVVVVAAALVAAAVFAPADLGARLMVMAGTAGVLARLLADWRACVAVTVFATLVFVGFMAHQYGELAERPLAVVAYDRHRLRRPDRPWPTLDSRRQRPRGRHTDGRSAVPVTAKTSRRLTALLADGPVTVFLMDLNDFKPVNDTYGARRWRPAAHEANRY